MEFPPAQTVSSWDVKDLGNGIFEIYATITATGSAVNHDFDINFPFELLALYLQHVDVSLALSTDALTWELDRVKENEFPQPFPLVAYTSSATSNFLELFRGQEFILPLGSYRLTENTTNTDILYVRILVRVIVVA